MKILLFIYFFLSDRQAPVSVLWLSVKQVDLLLIVLIQLWLLHC